MADARTAAGRSRRLRVGLRTLQHRLTRPARRTALPVLRGSGRGLRVRVGESIIRVAARGEPQVEKAYLELLRPGDVVYDVGANIGWYSLLAARAVGASGTVLAFEPSLENALLAQQNAAVNGFANMTVVPAALTDREGWMSFIQKGSLEGRLESGDGETGGEQPARGRVRLEGRTLVPVTTLDAWLERTGQPPPSIVKIDVEGAEAGVLRGMKLTLASAMPTLIIELHGTRDAVAEQLDAAGYRHSVIERDVPTREAPSWAHVLAVPAAR